MIFDALLNHREAYTSLNNCSLVSKAWKHRVERSRVWAAIAKTHLGFKFSRFSLTGDAGKDSTRTPKSRLCQLQRRMKNLSQELDKVELKFDDSLLEEDEGRRHPSLILIEYCDGLIATGRRHMSMFKKLISVFC